MDYLTSLQNQGTQCLQCPFNHVIRDENAITDGFARKGVLS